MPEALKNLITSIGYLPGIGEKSASKLAFFLLNANPGYINTLSENMKSLKQNIWLCVDCYALTDIQYTKCSICSDDKRDTSTIAIVEEYLDMVTLEESWGYKWVYHILWGAISPMNWVFIADLKFAELFKRLEAAEEKIEIILATNPNIEGEATSSYIKEELEKRKLKHKVKITRLSRWLSSGYLEYADAITLVNAFRERKEM